MLSSRHFGSDSGNGNFDQRLPLKHGMVSTVAIFRLAEIAFSEVYTTIGELNSIPVMVCILVISVNDCFRFRFHF